MLNRRIGLLVTLLFCISIPGMIFAVDGQEQPRKFSWTELISSFEGQYFSELKETFNIVKDFLNDDESKKLLIAVLDDPSEYLTDEKVTKKVNNICNCVAALKSLSKIEKEIEGDIYKKHFEDWQKNHSILINSPEAQSEAYKIIACVDRFKQLAAIQKDVIGDIYKKLVADWLSNHSLLINNPVAQEEADKIIRRTSLTKMLRKANTFAKKDEHKKLIKQWLDNVSQLDDLEVVEQAKNVCLEVMEKYFEEKAEQVGTMRDVGITFFTIYRKMMLIKAIDTGKAAGWVQGMINGLSSALFVGANVYQRYLFNGKNLEKITVDFLGNPNILQNTILSASHMGRADEASMAIEKDYHILTEIARIANGDRDLSSLTKNNCKQLCEANIRQNGCQGEELDFFEFFDVFLDEKIESKVDSMFKAIKFPEFFSKVFWKNGVVSFARRMLLFKVFPTYVYYMGKQYFGEYANRGDSVSFVRYVPFKESVKSIIREVRREVSWKLIGLLNGTKNKDGDGFLDISHKLTFGVLGPDFFAAACSFFIRQSAIAISTKFTDGFLTRRDFGYEQDTFGRRLTLQTAFQTSKLFSTTVLYKLLGIIRPYLMGETSKKVSKFCRFMCRRGTMPGFFPKEAEESYTAEGMMQGLAGLVSSFGEFGYKLIYMNDTTVPDFGLHYAEKDAEKTGDSLKTLDFIIASWIGHAMGKSFGLFTYNKVYGNAV